MNLYRHVYILGNKPRGWEAVLDEAQQSFRLCCELIEKKGQGYIPEDDRVLATLEDLPLEDVRGVIIGQDPYPTDPTGYAFSSDTGVKPSLRNIYVELERSIPGFVVPPHGNITSWAKQGVLLLNADLTTVHGKSGAHKGLWRGVLSCVVKAINNLPRKVVWMLWGKEAQKIKDILGDGALVLEAPHPSPLNRHGGFVGCNHFSGINKYFESKGESPIDWRIPMTPPTRIIRQHQLVLPPTDTQTQPNRHPCEVIILEASEEDK